ELGAEDVGGHGEEPTYSVLVGAGGQGRGRGDGSDRAERTAGPRGADGDGEAAQQHGHVGALRAVVRVELVDDHIADVAAVPQRCVGGTLEQQVEHLVVGDQDVRRGQLHVLAAGVDLVVVRGRLVPDVQAGAYAAQLVVLGEQ